MTGKQLADLCRAQVGSGYVWGGLGYTFSQSRLDQLVKLYPAHYTAAYQSKAKALFGKKVFDCVGLVKHFLWGNTGDGVLRYYGANGIPDTTANGMLKLCVSTGAISTMPELPGLFVHMDGHCGVYVGNGKVVEARGIDYGVVETTLAGRGWKSWGKLPGVDYAAPVEYIHIETYPLSRYTVRPVRARLRASDAMGKVVDWAKANYASDATLEGAVNASMVNPDLKPIGTIYENGVNVANAGNGHGFGVDKSGAVRFGRFWADIDWQDAISGQPGLIYRGEKLPIDTTVALYKDRHPRQGVALLGDDILFVTVDGRRTGMPGMTMTEYRDYLHGLGCTEAIALDGGGSAIQLRDRTQTGKFEVVNSPLEHRMVYNVLGAWRKAETERPKEPVPDEQDEPEQTTPGKSITWAELVERLQADGIENIAL